ncbi:protein TonB [Kaistia hirudinis]|uniref:Protein TonB n=1 Tax=Kaistia hirudinis TaxID=1293440 RepID=A0A840AP60_9HYPH|nr:energy transducer TonB [Kaistia hirudinis]MBB3930651.1 protein TonB [Kaistia hirudinis]
MLRRRWIVAIALSLVAHAGLVMALTPTDTTMEEAGSGAGSKVVGSVDAVIGIDMPVETLTEATEMASVQPVTQAETTTTEAAQAIETTEVAALQPTEITPPAPSVVEPAPLAATAPQEIEPQQAAPQEISATAPADPVDAPSQNEVASVTPLEETAAAAVESDLAAAAAVVPESEPVAAAPAVATIETASVAPTEAVASEIAPAEPVQPVEAPREVAAVTPVTPIEAIEPVREEIPEIAEAPKPEPRPAVKPEAKPERRAAKVRTALLPRKAEKPVTPPRGSGELADTKGGEEADADSEATDPGRGRSTEAGRGNAFKAGYAARVAAKLRRARRAIDDSDARGTAHVAFVIGAGGAISALRLVASSGNGDVDRAALATVQRAAPFPPPPKSPYPIRVPIEFRSR